MVDLSLSIVKLWLTACLSKPFETFERLILGRSYFSRFDFNVECSANTRVYRASQIQSVGSSCLALLKRWIDMKAADLERLLAVRGTLTENVANAVGWGASSIIGVFLLGCAISVWRLIFSAFCLYRIVRQSHAWRKLGRVKIGLSDRILVPFSTRGLRNYYIVIPSHMLGQKDEMKVSLAHELQHLRQGDIEWEILLEVLKPIFFWNPAYHAWKRQVEHLRELSCDSEVLKKGRVDIVSYCETLLSVCQRSLRKDRSFLIAFPKVTLVTADRSWREGMIRLNSGCN